MCIMKGTKLIITLSYLTASQVLIELNWILFITHWGFLLLSFSLLFSLSHHHHYHCAFNLNFSSSLWLQCNIYILIFLFYCFIFFMLVVVKTSPIATYSIQNKFSLWHVWYQQIPYFNIVYKILPSKKGKWKKKRELSGTELRYSS